jgi:hypothetical protein
VDGVAFVGNNKVSGAAPMTPLYCYCPLGHLHNGLWQWTAIVAFYFIATPF